MVVTNFIENIFLPFDFSKPFEMNDNPSYIYNQYAL